MLAAIEKASRAGKGVYAMKVLGGGHLAAGEAGTPEEAFAFIRGVKGVHAVAVGVKTREELLCDLALLAGEKPPEDLAAAVRGRQRALLIEEHCEGCGKCVERCRYGALSLGAEPRVIVDQAKCVLCGYCAAACRDFCIKVV